MMVDSLVVSVRGMRVRCWKCKQPSGAVVAVHPADRLELDEGCWHGDEVVLLLAQELLARVGKETLANQIKRRESRTAGGAYLSNGCHRCGALFGAYFLTQDVLRTAASGSESFRDFIELTRAPIPAARWELLLRDRTMLVG